jgi:putative thioredoxin
MRGAVDLAALAAQARRSEQGAPSGAVEVTDQSLQDLAQRSLRAPVLIAFVSSASPASEELAARLARIAGEEGGVTVGVCDVDAQPAIAQALQVAAVPTVVAILGGRPAPIFQGSADDEQLRGVVQQILQVAAQSGLGGDAAQPEAEQEPPLPPLHQEAYDAIERDDLDGAVAAYEQALKENPKDADAKAGRAQVRLMARVRDADPAAVRSAAAASPTDVSSQLAVADLDVLGGAIEDAFARLLDTFRAAGPEDRDRVRERLVELFDVVGGEDQRVIAARRALAAALY